MQGLGSGFTEQSASSGYKWKNENFLAFDGTNDSVNILSDELISSMHSGGMERSGSISLWFQMTDAVTTNSMLIDLTANSDNRIYMLYKHSNDTVSCTFKGGGTAKVASVDPPGGATLEGDDTWHHLVMTWTDDGSILTYYDSIANSTVDISGINFEGIDYETASEEESAILKIGESWSGASDFQGYIDEVLLSSAVLTQDEVTEIYNSGIPKDEGHNNNLAAYFRFEEGTGTSVMSTETKSSAGNMEGTISGATWGSSILSADQMDLADFLE